MRYVVIMAGGSGTRLWPLSRQGMPKQLLTLFEGKSLLRIAYERVQGVVPDENILICTGAAYLDAVIAEFPELPKENLLGEPTGRDSLNACAWSAAVIASRDEDAVIAMTTADALINPKEAFVAALDEAYRVAEADEEALVTFGVVPDEPATGYGYLHRSDAVAGFETACVVTEFKEKPDLQTAQQYVSSGEYWWNSGMFVWRAKTLLHQVELLLPQTHASIQEIVEDPEKVVDIFPKLFKTSVDFGLMEPVSQGRGSAHVRAVALPIEWHDVGDFATLAEQLHSEGEDNICEGLVTVLDASGNLVINRSTNGHMVAISGIKNMVVVHTDSVTMIVPLEKSQSVKQLVAEVDKKAGRQYQ
ncbi:MAG: mannose-1-phosphate guanylyltransferase [Propionibacteriaceae bacterium]